MDAASIRLASDVGAAVPEVAYEAGVPGDATVADPEDGVPGPGTRRRVREGESAVAAVDASAPAVEPGVDGAMAEAVLTLPEVGGRKRDAARRRPSPWSSRSWSSVKA